MLKDEPSKILLTEEGIAYFKLFLYFFKSFFTENTMHSFFPLYLLCHIFQNVTRSFISEYLFTSSILPSILIFKSSGCVFDIKVNRSSNIAFIASLFSIFLLKFIFVFQIIFAIQCSQNTLFIIFPKSTTK